MLRVTANAAKTASDRDSGLPRRGAERLAVRFAARAGAAGFLGLSIAYGLMAGGHLDDPRNPFYGMPGQIAGFFGYAAQEIHISGLERQRPETVLKAIGVRPDGPLFGFNPRLAKKLLENIDWVDSATLRRVHPNRLEIDLVERVPFAIWQRGGVRYVIDVTGAALSTLSANDYDDLLIVTGEGAQTTVVDLVNHMEGHPALRSRVRAAARVGQRRWTLYLDSGLRIALAENDLAGSLDRLMDLVRQENVFERAIGMIDLRSSERTVFMPLPDSQGDQTVRVSSVIE
ncbi:MAG: cell division protein FtsQ/DivIB [Aestuariivirgaceae bacterium]